MKSLFQKTFSFISLSSDFCSLSVFITKAFLPLLFGLSLFALASPKNVSFKDKLKQKIENKKAELNQKENVRKSPTKNREQLEKLVSSSPDETKEKEDLKARGVIVKFHRWPNKKQRKEIINRLKVSGLKKTKSIKSFEIQLFEWLEGNLTASSLAERACNKLKDLSYVKRCSPDHLLPLGDLQNSVKPKTSFLLASTDSKTEAGFIEHCPSCRKENSISPVPLNIRTCNLVSYERGLVAGKVQSGGTGSDYWVNVLTGNLSDYWAQELIGSDLLKEELENIPLPERENWIAVFDSPADDHNIHVKNLISDEGPHAVLPELGKKPIFSNQCN